MKKYLLSFVVLLTISIAVKAQFVEIPDSNFRNALIQLYPTCFNESKQLDTTCSLVVNATSLTPTNSEISSLEGVQYFKNITFLLCSGNNLTSLPELPNSITGLNCSENKLYMLSNLPNSLSNLVCNDNELTSLSNLPNSITYLDCDRNKITHIAELPKSLERLYCSSNLLTILPELPKSLFYLECTFNQLQALPSMPNSMRDLRCSFNKLTELPELPSLLQDLYCESNQLSMLPKLPETLSWLICGDNKLSSLPTLNQSLHFLECSGNQLSYLPILPESLGTIHCEQNRLISLPELPKRLNDLYCNVNQLTQLPELPENLTYLECTYNQLSSLPKLPTNLFWLRCSKNVQLECLPPLPRSLRNLFIKGTKITCLPNKPVGINVDSIISVCNNPDEICPIYPLAKGIIYLDDNKNNIFDSTEATLTEKIIIVAPNQWKGISDLSGRYWVKLDKGISNLWSCSSISRYTAVTPSSYEITPNTTGTLPTNYNFGIQFLEEVEDLSASLTSSVARPGFTTNVSVNAINEGTIAQTNITVKLKKPTDLSVMATSTPPSQIIDDTIIWENVSLDLFEKQAFHVEFQVPPSIPVGTPLTYEAWVIGIHGDSTLLDNYTQWTEIVRSSYDPNDKLVNKSTLPPVYDVEKDRLIYTIRFQNTGTDTAFTVIVKDEIPANLNLSTLKVINASHAYQLIVREKNIVEFAFPNIQLPDSTTNEPKSHGFVQFSIQPKAGLPVNEKIQNNASIFFDYNAPVLTNTAETEVKLVTGVANNKSLAFNLFPNPTNGAITVELPYSGAGNWVLSDISGRQMKIGSINHNQIIQSIEMSQLPSGTYFITIQLGNEVSTAKVVKL